MTFQATCMLICTLVFVIYFAVFSVMTYRAIRRRELEALFGILFMAFIGRALYECAMFWVSR